MDSIGNTTVTCRVWGQSERFGASSAAVSRRRSTGAEAHPGRDFVGRPPECIDQRRQARVVDPETGSRYGQRRDDRSFRAPDGGGGGSQSDLQLIDGDREPAVPGRIELLLDFG